MTPPKSDAAKSPHVHKWADKALLHEPSLKVCACGATLTDSEYRNSDADESRARDEFSVCELMEAWGELDQAIQRCYIPGRLEAERYPEEHLHDLRVKRDRMSRAITSLYLAQDERG